MTDWVIGTCGVLGIGVAVAVNVVRERRRLRAFYERGDLRGAWRARFPDLSEDAVGEFLRMFVEAFVLRRGAEFAFGPGDRVIDVYRAIYPPAGTGGDQCELEVFVISVRRRYGVDLAPLWREDATLGEVWEWVREGGSAAKELARGEC